MEMRVDDFAYNCDELLNVSKDLIVAFFELLSGPTSSCIHNLKKIYLPVSEKKDSFTKLLF